MSSRMKKVERFRFYKNKGFSEPLCHMFCDMDEKMEEKINEEPTYEMKQYIFDGVTVESVRRYTGLENDVIILVVPDKSVFPATINESITKNYLYVAASRARSALSIISTKEFFEEFLA